MRASWVARDNYHITLRFLGDIDPSIVGELKEFCISMVSTMPAFQCVLDRVGAFPSIERARVVWLGGQAPDEFRALSRSLSAGLLDLGFSRSRPDALVHVTLVRVKGHPDPALPTIISRLHPIPPLTAPIDRMTLMESTLTPRGAIYAPVFSVSLLNTKGEL